MDGDVDGGISDLRAVNGLADFPGGGAGEAVLEPSADLGIAVSPAAPVRVWFTAPGI
jgi:hypothetical protein